MSGRKIIFVMKWFWYGLLLLWFSSCSKDGDNRGGDGTGLVTLTLKARTLDAGLHNGKADEEAMYNLRVVILSKSEGGSWEVEHNSFDDFSYGLLVTNEREFKVEENSTKRIYLLANEKQVKDAEGKAIDLSDSDMYTPDSEGVAPVERVDFFWFQEENGNTGGLPMSAVYEVEMGDEPKIMTCHVVRAVNKITFTYANKTTQVPENPSDGQIFAKKRAIKLLGWTLENVADRTYLMPRVNKNGNGNFTVVDSERQHTRELEEGHWIDWMVKESEKGENTGQYEWLTDYEVPERATHATYTYWYDKEENAPNAKIIQPEADAPDESVYAAPAVYLPESRNEAWYDKEGKPDAELKLQQYRLTVITNELDFDLDGNDPKNWKAASYTAVLPQLFSLFRNTHVKVSITFKGEGQFAIFAEIVPWEKLGPFDGELVPACDSR